MPSGANRTQRAATAMGLALALLAGLVTGLAAPATAAVAIALNAGNGTVGVTQTLTATVSSSDIGAPTGTVSFTVNGQAIGSQGVGGNLGTRAEVSWTPSSTGTAAVVAQFVGDDGSQASDNRSVQVARVGTSTAIDAPASAGTSTTVTLTATVRASQGQYVPTGKVTFLLSGGTVIGSSSLDASGSATLPYTTPATASTVRVYASYAGDANANASTSATDSVSVSTRTSSIALTVPSPLFVSTQVTLTAKVTPSSATGTVDFSVDGRLLGTVRLANATASIAWVPTAAGTVDVTARYSGGGGLGSSSDTDRVTISQPLRTDQITVDPSGDAAAWTPGGTVTLANGNAVALDIRSMSGLNVRLAIAGPCALEGTTVRVKGVGGPCTLTASTNGGNGWAPVTQRYYISTVAGSQVAKVLAPPSGAYARGSRLRLSRLDAVTNVNQPLRWKVTKGTARCRIVASGKFYVVQLRKRGQCTVRGYAPPIADQWKAFRTARTYTVR